MRAPTVSTQARRKEDAIKTQILKQNQRFNPQIAPPAALQPARGPMHSDDNSHRIHIAANDPGFPAKREAAVALICAAITDIATPVGYTCKGTTWSRTTPQGRSAINLQRSRYGFTASITLRFLLPDGTSPTEGIWAQDDDITLQNFTDATDGPDLANIAYIEIIENPASLDRPMHILANHALPWLDAHHRDRSDDDNPPSP